FAFMILTRRASSLAPGTIPRLDTSACRQRWQPRAAAASRSPRTLPAARYSLGRSAHLDELPVAAVRVMHVPPARAKAGALVDGDGATVECGDGERELLWIEPGANLLE